MKIIWYCIFQLCDLVRLFHSPAFSRSCVFSRPLLHSNTGAQHLRKRFNVIRAHPPSQRQNSHPLIQFAYSVWGALQVSPMGLGVKPRPDSILGILSSSRQVSSATSA